MSWIAAATPRVSASSAADGATRRPDDEDGIRPDRRGRQFAVKDRGIRVNVVSPGATETPGLAGPAGPEEIAEVVAVLASDAASVVNGADIQVVGGSAQV